jgi:UDP-N-acetylglucosamine diphosphorylase/glucosamine-1-phosphate N-acetyltransferase
MLHVVVLAAGKGTRMVSSLAKVLHQVAGRPLLTWVLDAVGGLDPDRVVVVVGHQADEVRRLLPADTVAVLQEPQLGTGHAVMIAMDAAAIGGDDTVVVVPGDMPLVRAASLVELLEAHASAGVAASVLTAVVAEPGTHGRVLRDATGAVTAIVEHADATETQRAVREVNTSVYAFHAAPLMAALAVLRPDNAKGEFYLTDVVAELTERGHRVSPVVLGDPEEALGVNTPDELARAAQILAERAV